MIKVTIVESKTKEEKPFPKLMQGDDGSIIEVLSEPNNFRTAPVVVRILGEKLQAKVGFAASFTIDGVVKFTDFNEAITIQNA
jgi:hypothetical protein